ncbi:uncharacterized protein J3R85_019333 [Psidium guajava]|nr:uncharacterized protein J3R85_019333 [Psidium guajava]
MFLSPIGDHRVGRSIIELASLVLVVPNVSEGVLDVHGEDNHKMHRQDKRAAVGNRTDQSTVQSHMKFAPHSEHSICSLTSRGATVKNRGFGAAGSDDSSCIVLHAPYMCRALHIF